MDPQIVESIIWGLGYGFAIISVWAVGAHWTLWEFPSPLIPQEGNDAPPRVRDRGTQTDPTREDGSTGRDEQQKSTDPPEGDVAIGEEAEPKSMSPQNKKKGKNPDRFGHPSDPTDAETISRLQYQIMTQGETLKEQGEELERCENLRKTERQRNRDEGAKFKEKIAKLQKDLDEAHSGSDRTPYRASARDVSALSETQRKLATANNNLEAKQRELQNVGAELGRKLAEEQTKLSEAATARDIALGETRNARTLAKTAREEEATARNKLNALEQRKSTVQEDLTATEADVEKKRKSLDSLDKELKRKRREAEQALSLEVDEQKRVRTAAHEVELVEKKRRHFMVHDDALEKKKREDFKKHEDALKEKKRTDFEALDKAVDDKRRADFAEIDKQFKKKQDFLGTLDSDLEQRRNEMTQLQRDIETAKRRANQELENTNAAKSRVQGEVDSANATLNATRTSISEAQRKLDGLKADAEKQQKDFDAKKSRIESEYLTAYKRADDQLQGVKDQVAAAQRQLEEVREQVRLQQQQSDNQSYNYIPLANATPASSAQDPSFDNAGNSLTANGFRPHANTQQQAPPNGSFFGDTGSNTPPFGIPGQHAVQGTSVQPSSGSESNEVPGENFHGHNGMSGVEEDDVMDIDDIDSRNRAAPSYVDSTASQQGPGASASTMARPTTAPPPSAPSEIKFVGKNFGIGHLLQPSKQSSTPVPAQTGTNNFKDFQSLKDRSKDVKQADAIKPIFAPMPPSRPQLTPRSARQAPQATLVPSCSQSTFNFGGTPTSSGHVFGQSTQARIQQQQPSPREDHSTGQDPAQGVKSFEAQQSGKRAVIRPKARLRRAAPADDEVKGFLNGEYDKPLEKLRDRFHIKEGYGFDTNFLEQLRRLGWAEKPLPTNEEISDYFGDNGAGEDFLPTDGTVREYYRGRGQESVTLNELCEEWAIDEVDRERLRLQVQRLGLLAVDSVEVKSPSEIDDGGRNHDDHSDDQVPNGGGADGAAQGDEDEDMSDDHGSPSQHPNSGHSDTDRSGHPHRVSQNDDEQYSPAVSSNSDDALEGTHSDHDDLMNILDDGRGGENFDDSTEFNEALPTDDEVEAYFVSRIQEVEGDMRELVVTMYEVCENFNIPPQDRTRCNKFRNAIRSMSWPVLPTDYEVQECHTAYGTMTTLELCGEFEIFSHVNPALYKVFCEQLRRLEIPCDTTSEKSDESGDEDDEEDDDHDESSIPSGSQEKFKGDDEDHRPNESSDGDDAAGSGSDEDKIPSYKDTRDSSSRRDKTDHLSNRSQSPELIKIGGNSVAETYIHSPFNGPNPWAEYQTRNANYASTPSAPVGGLSFVAPSTSPYPTQQPRTSFHHAATGVTYHPSMPTPSPNYGQQSSPSHVLKGGMSTSPTWKPTIPSTSPYHGQQQSPAYTRFDGGSTAQTSARTVPSTSPYYGQQPPAAFLRATQAANYGKSKEEGSGM